MLENAWVIPAITFTSFWLILFFGKRLPKGGSEIGVLAVGATLLLSIVAGAQWVDRDKGLEVEVHHAPSSESEHGEELEAEDEEHSLGGAPIVLIAEEEGEGEHGAEVEHIRGPVVKEWSWFTTGGLDIKVGTHI